MARHGYPEDFVHFHMAYESRSHFPFCQYFAAACDPRRRHDPWVGLTSSALRAFLIHHDTTVVPLLIALHTVGLHQGHRAISE